MHSFIYAKYFAVVFFQFNFLWKYFESSLLPIQEEEREINSSDLQSKLNCFNKILFYKNNQRPFFHPNRQCHYPSPQAEPPGSNKSITGSANLTFSLKSFGSAYTWCFSHRASLEELISSCELYLRWSHHLPACSWKIYTGINSEPISCDWLCPAHFSSHISSSLKPDSSTSITWSCIPSAHHPSMLGTLSSSPAPSKDWSFLVVLHS